MNAPNHFNGFSRDRAAFCDWYHTPKGRMLLELEVAFLSRYLRVSYNQMVLQVGSLGWEDRFLDEDLFRNIIVVDHAMHCNKKAQKVISEIQRLPVATESIDTIIMPHTLEFERNQHEVLREVERVLKPEGQVLLLGFNPWSIYGLLCLIPVKNRAVPWCGNFVSRRRTADWLRLLNFEMGGPGGGYIRLRNRGTQLLEDRRVSVLSLGYAIKAIKRRYTLIPLVSPKKAKNQFATVGTVETSTPIRVNERPG